MRYKLYYNGDKVVCYNDDSLYLFMQGRHGWSKDTTTISISVSNGVLFYNLSNLSPRTQYLLDNNLLGIGLFVKDHPSWISKGLRSALTLQNHIDRRCLSVMQINSTSGGFLISNFIDPGNGAISYQLKFIFLKSYEYHAPYVASGYENLSVGIGRYHSRDKGFRPYKMSNYAEITVQNIIE